MSVHINLGSWGSVFAVPSTVVDEHLKLCSPQQLKILLFLLRNSDKSFTNKEIGDALLIHEADVKDSIRFWVDRNVLCERDGELFPDESVSEKPAEKTKPAAKKTVVSRPKKPDIITAAQRVSADDNLRFTLAEVEAALSKPLSSGDTSTVVMLYDTLGLPGEVIIMLVNYCVSVGKGNMRAIERLGIRWADNGIDTVEAADNSIKKAKASTMNWNRVSSVFGLHNVGSPTVKQLSYVDVWIGDWHFSDEMLRAAYETCVDNTGKMSLAYINKVLQRWHNAGIANPEDIEKLDAKKSVVKKNNSSFDIDELDKIQ
ncbi:MAG: DnaD domain protein [Ruminococcus sp.]|jgi:DnaD/phage-associated family protein|nr:DnaD domain protein [Ruminococcus sp.]